MNTDSPTPAAATDDWRFEGACRTHDPELFFPVGNNVQGQLATKQAKAICNGCHLREQCLEHALTNDIRYGIWGGTTERERARLARRLAPDESGNVAALLEHAADQITRLDAEGLKPGEIAAHIGSTAQAVSSALLRLKPKPTTQ